MRKQIKTGGTTGKVVKSMQCGDWEKELLIVFEDLTYIHLEATNMCDGDLVIEETHFDPLDFGISQTLLSGLYTHEELIELSNERKVQQTAKCKAGRRAHYEQLKKEFEDE